MTIPEITAYVMALTPDDVRRLTATEIMGWTYCRNGQPAINLHSYQNQDGYTMSVLSWRPDIDRNQSRQVTNMIGTKSLMRLYKVFNEAFEWESHWDITPDQESRAALIAHMIHAEEAKNDTN